MRPRRLRFPVHRVIVTATIGLCLLCVHARPCPGSAAVPRDPTLQVPPREGNQGADDLGSLDVSNLLWLARDFNRQGRYDEAARHARAATRRDGVGPEVLCPAWMNVFYAAHRTGDKEAAAAAIRSFDDSAARLPANDPVLIEMAELKQALGLGGAVAPAAVAPTPAEGDGFWQSADPAALGLDLGAIKEHEEHAKKSGADGVLIAYRGKIISEWYSPRYRTPAATMSSVKSITGLLAGLLIADGKLALDDPVSRFVPGWSEGLRGRVTVRHLLTMTSGLNQARAPGQGVGFAADKNAYVVGLAPTSEPGSRWDYSNEGTQLLSPILEKAAGVPLQDYARERLFRPLGMDETRLRLDAKGHAWTYADAETSLRDFARLGELMRNQGRWRGRQVVSEVWALSSTQPYRRNASYGYLWWLIDNPKGFAARGYLDTNCYVFPELELAVSRIQARPYLFATEPYEPKALALFRRIVRKQLGPHG
jgi:CubicO group peptidase (beta-lactamase class C family)